MKIKLLVAAAGALVLAGMGLGASAFAASGGSLPFLAAAQPTPSPGARGQACQDFLHHLAANLGVSDGKLHSALQQSADQTIDDAVAAGKLSAAQAARIKARLASGGACRFDLRRGAARARGAQMLLLKAAAQTLGLSPQQLMQDLRQGRTLSSLAHGMTEDQFRQALIKNLKPELDALVKQGKLTQAREDGLLQRLQTTPIPFWNSAPHFRGGAAGPAASPSPAA